MLAPGHRISHANPHCRLDTITPPPVASKQPSATLPPKVPLPLRPSSTLRAILTDVQFWVPVGVLGLGVAVLIWLH